MMAQFELEYFTEDQKKWDEDFLLSEYSSIEDVDWSKKYELYYVPIYPKHPGDNVYMEFLCSSAMAKNAVGPGTNDAWVFYMLVQLYYRLACIMILNLMCRGNVNARFNFVLKRKTCRPMIIFTQWFLKSCN